jgi:signal transduction histidine kinase
MKEAASISDTPTAIPGQTDRLLTAKIIAPLPGGTMLDGWTRLVQVTHPWQGTDPECTLELDDSDLVRQTSDDLFEKVERAKREWESTVDSLPDLVCLIDRAGCVMRVNRIIEEWQLGRVDLVKGRLLHDLLHPDCQQPECYCDVLIKRSIVCAAQGESVQQEAYDPILKRHVQVHTHPVKGYDGEIASTIVVVVRDISERKQIEHDRERLIADLNAYAHTVAHDLKNPVGVIIGFADMLERDLTSFSLQDIGDFAQAISRSGQKLIGIIDELLLFAQVQSAEVEVGPLDMASVVAEAIFRLSHVKAEYRAEISIPEKWPVAIGHAQWIEEVWVNYISNALKYGGRPPRVELGSDLRPDGSVRFWVRDNGDGIATETRAQLFAPFSRFAPTRAAGHGLGLSIVQRIVEKLDGQVGVESTGAPGMGSLFYFTLPVASALRQHLW